MLRNETAQLAALPISGSQEDRSVQFSGFLLGRLVQMGRSWDSLFPITGLFFWIAGSCKFVLVTAKAGPFAKDT